MSDTAQSPNPLSPDHTLKEVAAALRMSERWVRNRIKAGLSGEGPVVEHERRGHKIVFTAEQVEKLRTAHTVAPPPAESITTGPRRRKTA